MSKRGLLAALLKQDAVTIDADGRIVPAVQRRHYPRTTPKRNLDSQGCHLFNTARRNFSGDKME